MRRIDQDGPTGHHWNQRQNAGGVENQQQITGSDRANEPDQVFASIDDPAKRDGPRASLIGDCFGNGRHCVPCQRLERERRQLWLARPSLTVGLLTPPTLLLNLCPSFQPAFRGPTIQSSSGPRLQGPLLRGVSPPVSPRR